MTGEHEAVRSFLEPHDGIYAVRTQAPGPEGSLPLTAELLRDSPSGTVFGMTQNAGMGWPRANMLGPQVMIVSTAGGMRSEDGRPIALGPRSSGSRPATRGCPPR